jgi:FG-GAP repeat
MLAVRRGLAALSSVVLAGGMLLAQQPAAAATTTLTTITRGDGTGVSLQVAHVDGTASFTDMRPRSRLDIDGDGRDEIVVSGYNGSFQWIVAVRMSRTGAIDRIMPPTGDFGGATVGDFDKDGFGDLAVTDSRGNPGTPSLSGSVWVFYGGLGGFVLDRTGWLTEGVGGVPGTPNGGRWGFTLAAGDLNGDGYSDLAAASQYKGGAFAGSVTLLRGGPSGLTGGGSTVLTEASLGFSPTIAGFGSSVAIGDLTGDGRPELVIGAQHDASGGDAYGRLFVLQGTASGPQLTNPTTIDAITVSNLMVSAGSLGSELAIGDVNGDGFGDIVAGASDAGVDGRIQAGAVIAFYGSASGVSAARRTTVHEHTTGVPGEPDSAEAFGASVSVGDVTGDGIADVLVGAPYDTVGSAQQAGAAYLFRGSAQGLTATGSQLFTQDSPNVPGNAGFQHIFGLGTILDLDGTGPLDALIPAMMDGSIARFIGGASGLTATGALDTTDLIPSGQWFGVPARGVAAFAGGPMSSGIIAGNTLARTEVTIAAPAPMSYGGPSSRTAARGANATVGALTDSTERGPSGIASEPAGPAALQSSGPARFDLDGDGQDETVVTANPLTVLRYSGLGRVDLLRSPYGTMVEALAAGDFNGDGFTDLALGDGQEHAPGRSDLVAAGAIWVCSGSAQGLRYDDCLHWSQDSPGVPDRAEMQDRFGAALAAGDLNGDGYADLAVGTPNEGLSSLIAKRVRQPAQLDNAGAVTLLYGSPTGLTTTRARFLTQPLDIGPGLVGMAETNDQFGTSLAIGDVTGDGVADLAVGVLNENYRKKADDYHFEGEVDLFAGGAAGLSKAPISRVTGLGVGDNRYTSFFGYTLAIADTTGDGKGEVLVAAPYAYFGSNTFGAIVEYTGGSAGITSAAARVLRPGVGGVPAMSGQATFGFALATGDVTGDGRIDVLIGAPDATAGGKQYAGAAMLLPGSPAGLTTAGAQMLTASSLDSFGRCVAIVNGGAVVGAPGGGSAGETASGAFVDYTGGGSLVLGPVTTAAQLVPRNAVLVSLGSTALRR